MWGDMMLDYLMKYNMSREEIYDLKNMLTKEVLASYMLSSTTIIDNLNYYKELGITNLSNIIKYRPDLLLSDRKNIDNILSKVDKDLFISLIDNNIDDLILFGV